MVMKITGAEVYLTSEHQYYTQTSQKETLRLWAGGTQGWAPTDQLQLSDEARQALQARLSQVAREAPEPGELTISEEDKAKMLLLKKMFKLLTGKEITFVIPRIALKRQEGSQPSQGSPVLQRSSGLGWGLDYSLHTSFREEESTTFSSHGVVKTADGREIEFTVDLRMSRSFVRENHISIKAGQALQDPLVINYSGPAAALTDTKYSFDLDADSTADQMSFLQPGSGFLALDLNEDGVVNNGGELFGTATGDGFAELAAYDQDHNGWIDENDEVFSRLSIWTKDSEGRDVLFALGGKGVGAIFLGRVDAPFSLNNQDNTMLGQARTAGIFLREDGSAGTVQQIDLVI